MATSIEQKDVSRLSNGWWIFSGNITCEENFWWSTQIRAAVLAENIYEHN